MMILIRYFFNILLFNDFWFLFRCPYPDQQISADLGSQEGQIRNTDFVTINIFFEKKGGGA